MSHEVQRLTPEQYMDEMQAIVPDWDRTALPIQPSNEANVWIFAEANRHPLPCGGVPFREIARAVRRAFDLGIIPAYSGVLTYYIWLTQQELTERPNAQ